VSFSIISSQSKKPSKNLSLDFKNSNFNSINLYLANCSDDFWFEIFRNHTVEENYTIFLEIMRNVFERFVPHRKTHVTHYPRKILSLFKKKIKAHRSGNSQKHKQLSSEWKRAILNHEIKKEEKLVANTSSKKFYDFVKKRTKVVMDDFPLKDTDGKLIFDDLDRANHFQQQFSSVFIEDKRTQPFLA
jgi:hypothetical protein